MTIFKYIRLQDISGFFQVDFVKRYYSVRTGNLPGLAEKTCLDWLKIGEFANRTGGRLMTFFSFPDIIMYRAGYQIRQQHVKGMDRWNSNQSILKS